MICVCLTKYYSGDKIEEDKMGGACCTYWRRKKVLMGKPGGKRPLGSPRHRQKDNINIDLK
jgi:hypothetical protein